uniref:Senescence domain-containing protein n=1 Tax=Neobodo designis TaxID=312471 RepID=A0A7S1Q024_NEODS
MSTVRSLGRVAASAVRGGGSAVAGAVGFGSKALSSAIDATGRAVVEGTTPNQDPATHYDPGLAARGAVKTARVATKGLRVAAKGVGYAAEGVYSVGGRTLAPLLPTALTQSPVVGAVAEVGTAAAASAIEVYEATADAAADTADATSVAVGRVVGHKYGPAAGALAEDAIGITVDAAEIGREVGRLKLVHAAPRLARHALTAAVDSSAAHEHASSSRAAPAVPPSDQPLPLGESTATKDSAATLTETALTPPLVAAARAQQSLTTPAS